MIRRFVTMFFLAAFILFITSGCSSKQSGPYNYKLYPGDKLVDKHIAKLFLDRKNLERKRYVIYINDMRVNEYDQIDLLPGEYKIDSIKHAKEWREIYIDYNLKMDLVTCNTKVRLIGGYSYLLNMKMENEKFYCISITNPKTGETIGKKCCSN